MPDKRNTKQGSYSAKHLDSSRYCDYNSSSTKVSSTINVYPNHVYMMGPDNSANKTNGDNSIDHRKSTHYLHLTCQTKNSMANYAESWEHEDVHFRVAEKPEEVLIHQRGSSAYRIKKPGVEMPIKD
jgi:hypothetical protein